MSVYIIYAREDHAVAQRIAAHLDATAIPAAFDIKQFSEGSGFRARLEKQMRDADVVVFVMTPASAASAYCLEELNFAAGLGKQIVTAIPAPLPLNFVAPATAITEYLHLYDDASISDSGFAKSMERLVKRVEEVASWDPNRFHTNGERGPIKSFDFDPKRYVFISYPNDTNPDVLRAIVRSLLRRGVSVWMHDPSPCRLTPEEDLGVQSQDEDQRDRPGVHWHTLVTDAIDKASSVLLLIGRRSQEFQKSEIDHAIAKGKYHVVRIDDVPDAGVPEILLRSINRKLDASSMRADVIAAAVQRLADKLAKDVLGEEFAPVPKQVSPFVSIVRQWLVAAREFWTTFWPVVTGQYPLVLAALFSAALLFHVTLQAPYLPLVSLASLAIIAATAWRFWRGAQRERAPYGTIWARSRLAWASLALLIPLSVGYTLHRQSHEGPARVIASVDAPVSAVAAGVTEAGENRVAYATYDGWLYLTDPDSPRATASVQLADGDVRPVTQLLWHNAARVVAVREGEVLRWNGEGDPVAIWTGEGVPHVAMDEGQRLMIVETRPLTKEDARYAALSRLTIRGVGLGFAATIADQDITRSYTFAITVADPLAETVEAVHIQAKPILPSAIAARGSGREAELLIGSGDGELIVCSEAAMPSEITVPSDVMAFGCGTAISSGSASAITDITLSGERGVTRHRDGAAVDWTRFGDTWRLGALPLPLLTLEGHQGDILSVAFSLDGTRVATASQDGTARVWNAATGELQLTLAGHDGLVTSVSFFGDGSRILTSSYDGTVRVWSATTGRVLTTWPVRASGEIGFPAYCAAPSPDGSRVVTTDGTLRVWDAATGELLLTSPDQSGSTFVTFSTDGSRIIAAGGEDRAAHVLDATNGEPLLTLAGHQDRVFAAAYSPDGSRVITASRDRTARMWDAVTGLEVSKLEGHQGAVYSATFSNDGSRVATASGDGTARVWNPATVEALYILSGHESEVLSAAFSADGSHIATSSRDDTAQIWDVIAAERLAESNDIILSRLPGGYAQGRIRLPDSDVELAAFRDHAPEMATLPDGRIVAGGWDGRVMIVDPKAAGEMAQADPAAWIASLWAPVGDTARTMFANIPGLGSSNMWERLSAADRAIAIDRNPRVSTEAWFAVGSIIAMPREDFTAPVVEPGTTAVNGQPLPDAVMNRRRLDVESAIAARDRVGSRLEALGLSGIVTPGESGAMRVTLGILPTRQRVRQQPEPPPTQTNDYPAQSNDPDVQAVEPPVQRLTPRPQVTLPLRETPSGPAQTTATAEEAAAPIVRKSFAASSHMQALFALEDDCPASVTITQLQNDAALATACVVQQLRQSGDYEYAELDYIARPAQAAPALGVSAALRDQWAFGAGPGGANLSNLRWNGPIAQTAAGADGVVVAVIDTGIALDHPAISGAAWLAPGYDMVSDPLMGNDGDGRDANPEDPGDRCNTDDPRAANSLHGTHVAGLVAAAGAGGLKLVPVRALGRCGGKLSDINDAIQWAASVIPGRDTQGAEVWNANPADIINLSFEFPVACPASLQNAIDRAVAAGAVVVAAAGNGGRDASVWSPGGCRNVVSVGATDARGAPAAYSNFGASVSLYAPGGDLSRDDNGDGVEDGVVSWGEGAARCVDALTGETRSECRHAMTAGTSNAAAVTTAALAILKSQNPASTNGDLLVELMTSSRASCIAHPNPRHRRACISWNGGPVRLLGGEKVEPAPGSDAVSAGNDPQRGFRRVPEVSAETVVAFATSSGGVAQEGVYAAILAEELSRPDVDIGQVLTRTRSRVVERSRGGQQPEFTSTLSENLCVGCAATGPRLALVIAQAEYSDIIRIAKAGEEAAMVADVLTKLGFDVLFVRDQSKAGLEAAFQQFAARLKSAGVGATAFVYYTGHGLQYQGSNYMLGTDARLTSEADVARHGVDLADQIGLFQDTSARVVFVLDASRDAPPVAGSR